MIKINNYILTYLFLLFIGILLYKYFPFENYIPYDENKLYNLKKNQTLFMYVPLNKLTFSQSNVSNQMSNDEDLVNYSKRLKDYYHKNNKISFLDRDPPRAIYWPDNNSLQLLDNRRAVAVIKIFCPNCINTSDLPNNIYIPVRIYHPDTELEERYKNKYHPTRCFKTKEFCDSIGKFRKPNTYGEAVVFRSINSYNNYTPNTITNLIPNIENN